MARERWKMVDVEGDLQPVFTSAKKNSPDPQLVFDEDGVYTVTFERQDESGSARRFLTSGGVDGE